MTETDRKRLVEAMAEAIWQAECPIWQAECLRANGQPRRATWLEVGDDTWSTYRPLAKEALAAAERAGFAFSQGWRQIETLTFDDRMVVFSDGRTSFADYADKDSDAAYWRKREVTLWQPLPPPPKGDADDPR